jgi:hypothetical protein
MHHRSFLLYFLVGSIEPLLIAVLAAMAMRGGLRTIVVTLLVYLGACGFWIYSHLDRRRMISKPFEDGFLSGALVTTVSLTIVLSLNAWAHRRKQNARPRGFPILPANRSAKPTGDSSTASERE